MLKFLWEWWISSGGILPWVEANQGLVSVLSIGAAWWMAIRQQKAALDAEARSNERARQAKEEGLREAREAEIDRRIGLGSDFANAAKGVIDDAIKVLFEARPDLDKIFERRTTWHLSELTGASLKATVSTLSALLSTPPPAPFLIRAVSEALGDLHAIQAYVGPDGMRLRSDDYKELLRIWNELLVGCKMDIQEAELAYRSGLRPPPPIAAPTSHSHF